MNSPLKEELKKSILAELNETLVRWETREQIIANLDKWNEPQLMELLSDLHCRKNPKIMNDIKKQIAKKMAYLKRKLKTETQKIEKFLNQNKNAAAG